MEIVNKVAQSGLVTLNLDQYKPIGESVVLDIKDQLFMGLVLKEKDFRAFVQNHDWAQYAGQNVAVTCSTDAIVPAWAYILIATRLQPFTQNFILGTAAELEIALWRQNLQNADLESFADQRLILKGCGETPAAIYVEAARLLTPYVKTLMYGEPCSTIPIYKKQAAPKAEKAAKP